MKKFMTIALSAIMLLALASCKADAKEQSEALNSEGVQIPNPFIDCENIEEAQKIAGFDISVPKDIAVDRGDRKIRAVESEMIEIIYTDNAEQKLSIRKGIGEKDISGSYEAYEKTVEAAVDGINAELKGNNDSFYVAVWTFDGYSFSVADKTGLTKEEMKALIAEIK